MILKEKHSFCFVLNMCNNINVNNKWEYLCWYDVNKNNILSKYNRDMISIRDDIDSIRDWMKKQPHLTNYHVCM